MLEYSIGAAMIIACSWPMLFLFSSTIAIAIA